MLERGKMDRGIVEIVDTESLVPKDHLLRKIDAAVDFNRLYDMQRMQIIKVPQLKLRRKFSCSFSKCYLPICLQRYLLEILRQRISMEKW